MKRYVVEYPENMEQEWKRPPPNPKAVRDAMTWLLGRDLAVVATAINQGPNGWKCGLEVKPVDLEAMPVMTIEGVAIYDTSGKSR